MTEAIKTETPAKAETARKVQELNPSRMKECEFERTTYVATAHEQTQPEDLLEPEYWSHVAEKLKPWDKIEARADDGSWYAEYLVLDTSCRWARLALLAKYDLTTSDVSLSQAARDEYKIEWKGPARKFCVIRNSDNAMVHEGEQTKVGAHQWLINRLKSE